MPCIIKQVSQYVQWTRIDKSIHLQSKTDIQKFTVGEQFMVYGFQ